jgi:3-keto-disaccharide hydrolase
MKIPPSLCRQSRPIQASCLIWLLLLLGVTGLAQNDPNRKDWVPMFNDKNLDGWTIKIAHQDLGDNYRDTFRVEDGVIKVSYDKYDEFGTRFGHAYYQEKLSYYIVSLEYRFVGEMMKDAPAFARLNSGLMIHSQAPETILKEQNYPISIEAQLLGETAGSTAERHTMNVCTPGTEIFMNGEMVKAHCTPSTSKTYRGDEWIKVEVEVLGSEHVRHIIDGETVLQFEQPQIGGGVVAGFDPAVKRDGMLLSEGYVALQAEGQPVEFRNIQLLQLSGCMDPKASNYKSYYVHRDDSKCVFGGAAAR